jgi:hypothetical protein
MEPLPADEFQILDLRDGATARKRPRQIDDVYALAADIGGMGFISRNHAQILHNNSLINLHTLEGARLTTCLVQPTLMLCSVVELKFAKEVSVSPTVMFAKPPQGFGRIRPSAEAGSRNI